MDNGMDRWTDGQWVDGQMDTVHGQIDTVDGQLFDNHTLQGVGNIISNL